MKPRLILLPCFHVLAVSACVLLATPLTAAGQNAAVVQASNANANLVWPLPPDKPRIRFVGMYENNFDVEPRKKRSWSDRLIGKEDPNVTEIFEKPAGVTGDSKGRIIVTAMQRSTVYIIDKDKHQILRLRGDRGILLKNPIGVAVDQQDNIFVADPMLRMVLKFSASGQLLATLGQEPGLKNPTFLALDEVRRRLFVVDSHLHQVLVYNIETLQLIQTLGKRGDKNGEFNYPVGVATNRDGYFAVTDTGSCSVQIFSPDFAFIRRIGRQGTRPGEFVRPKGVAYDGDGNLYVVDAAFNNLQIFNDKGQILMFLGGFGHAPGMFNLPLGISIDARNRIYVGDQLNHRVQVFQYLADK